MQWLLGRWTRDELVAVLEHLYRKSGDRVWRSLARMRLKREYKEPMAAGRQLLMSPFGEKVRRMTADTALTRNRFVAALADTVLIAHAQPGSKTEQLAQEVVGWGKPVYTLDHPANEHLLALGAEPKAVFPAHDLQTDEREKATCVNCSRTPMDRRMVKAVG